MRREVHFRSRFFTKEQTREKEDWLNEHFTQGYMIVELEETESGYFVQLIYDPYARMHTRIRYFPQGQEKLLDDWITERFRDGWQLDVNASQKGYWAILYREDEEKLPPLPILLLNQLVDLWWLWFIGTVVFGILWYCSL
jgi:hypothetical protein